MAWLHLWNSILFLLTTVVATGSTFSETDKNIMHAIAGNPFIIRTWSVIGSTLFITVKKNNNTILDVSTDVVIAKPATDQNGRMMLKYNQSIQEVCLLFENVSKEDEGLYEMKESFYRTNPISNEHEADAYERKDGTWNLELYVLGPGEIKQGYVGENISMEFEKSIKQSTLYNYDELSALLAGSGCSVSTDSSLYGRLRCTKDNSGKMFKITIVNVSQREAGLYKIATGGVESGRCFFVIKDRPICAVVGNNMTIGWFYNQQGIKRTLRVIHPNQGVMMLLQQTNPPQIKSSFQHRLLYSGDTSQGYILFTLLNVKQSDAGLYTIETLHGNTIPGSKEMIVEGTCTTSGSIQTTLNDDTTKKSVTREALVTVQHTDRHFSDIETASTRITMKLDASSIKISHYAPTDDLYGVPIYVVIPVVTAAVVVIIAMTGCLIWIQRTNSNTLEAVQRLVVEKSEIISFASPSIIRRPTSRSFREEGWERRLAHSNIMLDHPYAAIPSGSGLVDTAWYSTFLLSELEDDKQSDNFIANLNGSSKMTDEKILITCVEQTDDDSLDSYSSVYSLAKAEDHGEYGNNRIVDGIGKRHVSQNIQALNGKDTTRRTDGLCEDEYEMVDSSLAFHPGKTLEDDSIDSESSKRQTTLCHEQSLVLEKCEPASFVTPSTIRRPQSMSLSEEEWTHGPVPETTTLSNATIGHPFRAISTTSASLDNAWCSTYSLSKPGGDKTSVNCIANPNDTIGRTDEKTLTSFDGGAVDGVLDSCRYVCPLGSAAGCEEHRYKLISYGNGPSQVSQRIQSLYTQVKKRPNVASKNTTMGGTDTLCGDEYEMVHISTDFGPYQTLQDVNIGCESAKCQNMLCNG